MKKTILILGGYGFLGTNIMKYVDENLLDTYRFIVFDKFAQHLGGVRFQCVDKCYVGDFADCMLMERIFQENHLDVVIHSLSTTIPVNSLNARYDVESNLLPTIDILGLMVKYGVNDIIYLSSGGAIYGTSHGKKHKESDDVFPISSYGVVKLAIEKYLMQYQQLYCIHPLIIRLSNPYGPYHYNMKQGVCNVALALAHQGKTMKIWGDGKGRKDYIYVTDFVEILFRLWQKGIRDDVINIGSGQTYSVNEIAEVVKKLMPSFQTEYIEAETFDTSNFELDTTKLRLLIGEYTFHSLTEGMIKTNEWTKTI